MLDQPFEILLGGMHRNAAHGDVFAQVLAALGERDIERLGRQRGIVEEQLVEIPHPVEQKIFRMRRLDLEKLRHGGRGALRELVHGGTLSDAVPAAPWHKGACKGPRV